MSHFSRNAGQNAITPTILISGEHRARRDRELYVTNNPDVVRTPWGGRLWPKSGFMSGDTSVPLDLFGSTIETYRKYDTFPIEVFGNGSKRKIIGITRDSAGAPLGSVTVQALRASDFVVAGQTVSDSGGYYEATTPFPATNHLLLAFKGGAPDLFGTGVRTIQPV